MLMATLQVKRVPEVLYAQAKLRAEAEGTSLSELVLRMLERELAVPSMRQWLETVNARNRSARTIDVQRHLDEARSEIEGE